MERAATRLPHIDAARGIAILLMTAGHITPNGSAAKTCIFAFHMPLFFVLTGLARGCRRGPGATHGAFTAYCGKQAYRLLLPYLVWALIWAPLTAKGLLYILYGTRESLLAAGSLTSLWFLPTLFVALLLAELLAHLARGNRAILAAAAVVLLVSGRLLPHPSPLGAPLGADIALPGCGFILLGEVAASWEHRLETLTGAGRYLAAACLTLFLLLLFGGGMRVAGNSVRHVLMAEAHYGIYRYFLLHALTGCGAVLALGILLERVALLRDIGTHTLGILVLHRFFIGLLPAASGWRQWILAAAVSALSYGASLLLYRWVPEIFGRRRTWGKC